MRWLSRLLKKPPLAVGLVGSVAFLGSSMGRIGVRDPFAAGLEGGFAACGHQLGASAMSLGSWTKL